MLDTSVKNLMFDLGAGREIYDADSNRVISKAEASDTIRKACFEYLGLTKDSSNKQIKRALNSERGTQFFEVIEEIIDTQIAHGLSENEFFNNYVESKNMKDGDVNEFWADDEVLLTVSKVSGDAHDLSIQRLGSGQSYHVDTAVYGIKVGGDIRLFLTGRKDWGAFVDAVVKAYIQKVQTLISSQFANSGPAHSNRCGYRHFQTLHGSISSRTASQRRGPRAGGQTAPSRSRASASRPQGQS